MKFTLAWARTFPPSDSQGWTIHFIERETRYWVDAQAGLKPYQLFERGTSRAGPLPSPARLIRWFTDGERRYGLTLWKLASVFLKAKETHPDDGYRKVWREGLEAAMKVKGSQGHRRIEWVKSEHPFTAISLEHEVHANHNEAHNSALRRRASAYRRRQNLYAKHVDALQRVLNIHRLIHNWVRPHWGLANKTTPALAQPCPVGYWRWDIAIRPISVHELLTSRGLHYVTP